MRDHFRIGFGDSLVPPGHICHFGTRHKGIQLAVDVLLAGIADGELCLLVGDDPFVHRVFRRLRARGVDISGSIKARRLVRVHCQSNGLALLGCIVSHLEVQPKCAFRLVGSPRYDRKGWPELHDLLAFEGWMDEIAARYKALYICIYDKTTATALVEHPHPKLIAGAEILDNPSYVPGPQFRERLRHGLPLGR